MKVAIYHDEMWVACVDDEGWESRPAIEVPDELVERYKAARKAFEDAEEALSFFAGPIYEDIAKKAAEACKHKPFRWPKYRPTAELADRIEKALFHG